MQKLIHFVKTLSPPSLSLFAKPSPTPSPPFRSQVFVLFLRSYKSASSTGDFVKTPMASSAAVKSPAPDDESFGLRLWNKLQDLWMPAEYTPFVVALAAGNLKLEVFREYIRQDKHFLHAFAEAYEMAEECADDDDDKVGIRELRKSVLEELKMHDSFVNEWGSDLPKEITPNAATEKYTNFLRDTALGNIEGLKAPGKLATPFEKTKLAAYTLGAMTPCMRLYAFLGSELKALVDPNKGNHAYQKWIDNYSSDEFMAATLRTEDRLDKLSVSLTGEELDIIENLYRIAIRLEIDFFLGQSLTQRTVVPLCREHNPAEQCLMLFSDFDLTCTVQDSSAILAQVAIFSAKKSDQTQSENQLARMSLADLRMNWIRLSEQYVVEYEKCLQSIMISEKGLSTAEEKFDYEGLCKALQLLTEFEQKANLKVIDSGVLKGLNLEDIKRKGESLHFRDGCTEFFLSAMAKENLNININILSYCWCGDLIRSAFSAGGLGAVKVHANELMYENEISTGNIDRKVESPIDKLQAFNNILENCSKDQKILSVYIGDSVGDLLCLLKADVGLVVGESPGLIKIGQQYGVSFVPLHQGLVEKQRQISEDNSPIWKGLSGVLYTVYSWAEIHAFILGL